MGTKLMIALMAQMKSKHFVVNDLGNIPDGVRELIAALRLNESIILELFIFDVFLMFI